MINRIFYYLQRPEKGWDPVPAEHALHYADSEWKNFDSIVSNNVDVIEKKLGSFSKKTVLDLGGGPGHYSAEFARRGALVTWHDISRRYQEYAKRKHQEYNLTIDYSVGYMEEVIKLNKKFDFVFNRICWYYCINDFDFARLIRDLLKPGGMSYLVIHHTGRGEEQRSPFAKFKIIINEAFGIKIGHPFPSKKRIQLSFANCDFKTVEYSFDDANAYVWLFL